MRLLGNVLHAAAERCAVCAAMNCSSRLLLLPPSRLRARQLPYFAAASPVLVAAPVVRCCGRPVAACCRDACCALRVARCAMRDARCELRVPRSAFHVPRSAFSFSASSENTSTHHILPNMDAIAIVQPGGPEVRCRARACLPPISHCLPRRPCRLCGGKFQPHPLAASSYKLRPGVVALFLLWHPCASHPVCQWSESTRRAAAEGTVRPSSWSQRSSRP